LSRGFHANCAISYFFYIYLMLYASKYSMKRGDKFFRWELNRALGMDILGREYFFKCWIFFQKMPDQLMHVI